MSRSACVPRSLRFCAAALAVFLLGACGPARATEVYRTKYEPLADVKIYPVDSEDLADCLIFITDEPSRADGRSDVWHLGHDRGRADVKIYSADTALLADYKIYFVDSEDRARCAVDWKSKKR